MMNSSNSTSKNLSTSTFLSFFLRKRILDISLYLSTIRQDLCDHCCQYNTSLLKTFCQRLIIHAMYNIKKLSIYPKEDIQSFSFLRKS